MYFDKVFNVLNFPYNKFNLFRGKYYVFCVPQKLHLYLSYLIPAVVVVETTVFEQQNSNMLKIDENYTRSIIQILHFVFLFVGLY